LLERREDYRIGTIPVGGLLLTAGGDVQKDRIEVSIWAFGVARLPGWSSTAC
jgi:phage terminase large subunit GpA-like protein